ncbi:hypothetical protein NQ317_003771 [Molorchus minor]|uniref:endo-polygalacturonase n=1 Tax=Molorchus minor TaxID=1323400 RepID=A0ABQ9IZY8_9CUCU|nr:hypothetical protein NQ317_003771 [Molorchus minor]
MGVFILILASLLALLVVPVIALNETQTRNSCTVTSYSQVDTAVGSCSDIVISGIEVPAGKALDLNLKDGTKITFDGHVKFAYAEWDGPLVHIKGHGITIEGTEGHVLDGQGALYWDGKGSSGKTKPVFIRIETTGGSVANNINLLNCPIWCASIKSSDLIVDGWTIDVADGDKNGGHNTDGFGVQNSTNTVIKNSVVKNQDDCVVVNYGSNLHISNIDCSGSHGLSLSVGQGSTYYMNTVHNVTFSDCNVKSSLNGIHVKTHSDGGEGEITDVTFQNINFSGITRYGINIQEDYANGGSTGTTNNNVPIKNLKMTNVEGTVKGSSSMAVYILCADGGCEDWSWSGVDITGGHKSNSCNFNPSGYTC